MNFIKNKGFTLVEIIVVLVIIAILSAVSIPTMLGFINAANEKIAIAECREVVVASQVLAVELFPANLIENDRSLEKTEYIERIYENSSSGGSILSVVVSPENGKITNIDYISMKDFYVNYNINANPVYQVKKMLPNTAPGHLKKAENILVDKKILDKIKEKDKQTKKLQEYFLKENKNEYPKFSDREIEMMSSLKYKNPEALNWRPIITKNGTVIMTGSTVSKNISNPVSSVIYYNGEYYYWSHNNQVKTSYVSDNYFDVSVLDDAKSEVTDGGKIGAWIKYVP